MEKGFAPAWMLEDGTQERAGREISNHTHGAEIGADGSAAELSGENAEFSADSIERRHNETEGASST